MPAHQTNLEAPHRCVLVENPKARRSSKQLGRLLRASLRVKRRGKL